MRKTAISASAFALITPLLLAGTASQAHAATNCFASSCTGLVAANTTCVNDGEVIYSVNIKNGSTVVGNIQLKYSPSCRATWARVISDLSNGSTGVIQNLQFMPGGVVLEEDCFGFGGPGTGCNTRMIDDLYPLTSRAVGSVNLNVNGNAVGNQTPAW